MCCDPVKFLVGRSSIAFVCISMVSTFLSDQAIIHTYMRDNLEKETYVYER